MIRSIFFSLMLVAVFACSAANVSAAELTHAVAADAKGDGPDGKGNTADDTWQFWFQLIHRPEYRRLDRHSSSIPNGIPGKVTGPVGGSTPNPKATQGWVYHSDWDGRYEGVWGDSKAPQVLMHPYNEKTSGGAVAVTYTVPADGKYNISGKVTDVNPAKVKHVMLTGITYKIDVVAPGDKSISKVIKSLKSQKVGDLVGPASAEFKLKKVSLKKGQLVRLVIDPNKWWGGDMTRIDLFKIEKAK
jgi:hypothetical protein